MIKHRHTVGSARQQQRQSPPAGPRRCARGFAYSFGGPVRVVDGSSGSESRVMPALTLKSEEAWPVPVGGSAARPLGAVRLRYLRTPEFELSEI
ncbi:hypothetical protein [Streptomyces sp. NPDC046870]|uniref:hypothetical protein n=1 Tax=Streptomyces sp. NPDC046870 TaxID=3155135 RepID=UPI003455E285